MIINEKYPKNFRINPGAFQHPHEVDHYSLWKPLLEVEQIKSKDQIKEYSFPYSYSINQFLGEKIDVKLINFNHDNSCQVIQIERKDYKNKTYILKRYFFQINSSVDKKEDTKKCEKNVNLVEIEKFLKENFNEYICYRIFCISPYGCEVKKYAIIQLFTPNKEYIVNEILMKSAGIKYSDINFKEFNLSETELKINIFVKLINGLYFLQCMRIVHNDIKEANIMIKYDKNKQQVTPAIIDYDAAKILSYTFKESDTWSYKLAMTQCFVAPEILLALKERENQNQESNFFDPWASEIYSFGILFFKIMNKKAFLSIRKSIDSYKKDKIEHEKIIKLIESIYEEEKDNSCKNIIYLIKLCLQYDPLLRPTVIELLTLITHLEDLRVKDMENLWEKLKLIRLEKNDKEKFNEQTIKKIQFEYQSEKKRLNKVISVQSKNNLILEKEYQEKIKEIEKVYYNKFSNKEINNNKDLINYDEDKTTKYYGTNLIDRIKIKYNIEEQKKKIENVNVLEIVAHNNKMGHEKNDEHIQNAKDKEKIQEGKKGKDIQIQSLQKRNEGLANSNGILEIQNLKKSLLKLRMEKEQLQRANNKRIVKNSFINNKNLKDKLNKQIAYLKDAKIDKEFSLMSVIEKERNLREQTEKKYQNLINEHKKMKLDFQEQCSNLIKIIEKKENDFSKLQSKFDNLAKESDKITDSCLSKILISEYIQEINESALEKKSQDKYYLCEMCELQNKLLKRSVVLKYEEDLSGKPKIIIDEFAANFEKSIKEKEFSLIYNSSLTGTLAMLLLNPHISALNKSDKFY